MFEQIKRYVLTDHTGAVLAYQGLADMTGFDYTKTALLQGKLTVQDAILTLDQILNRKMEANIYTATCSANYSAASGNRPPFTQTVSVTGIKESDEIGFVDLLSSTTDSTLAVNQTKNFGYITRIDAKNNAIFLRCDKKKPQIALPIKIVVFRKSFV